MAINEHEKFLADKVKGDIGEEYILNKFTGRHLEAYPSHSVGFDYRYSDVAVYYKGYFLTLIEVKSEQHQWEETGNHYLEYSYKGRKSGISSTEASWWAILLFKKDNSVIELIIPVDKLKNLARNYIGTKRDVAGGDNKHTRGVLIPIDELINLHNLYGYKR